MALTSKEMQNWLTSPEGKVLTQWQQHQFDELVPDIFGYYALQLGVLSIDALRCNRIPRRWQASVNTGETGLPPQLYFDDRAFPFSSDSLDLLILPHGLDLSIDPKVTLTEAARVLVPQGVLILSGLVNSVAWRKKYGQKLKLSEEPETTRKKTLSYWQVRSALENNNLALSAVRFCGRRFLLKKGAFMPKLSWIDHFIPAPWSLNHSMYCLTLVKRVQGTCLTLGKEWEIKKLPAAKKQPIVGKQANSSTRYE